MTFDLSAECASILDKLSDLLPDQSTAEVKLESDFVRYQAELIKLAIELQKKFPALADKKLGGLGKVYVYDPDGYIATVEQDVVSYWLHHPESLELTAREIGTLASSWYGRPVSEHRIKRRFRDHDLIIRLQRLCCEHDSNTDIRGCRSLPDIQKRLRVGALQAATDWRFRGEITFHSDNSVVIRGALAQQDTTKTGKRRVRGNGSAVSVVALREVLQAYS